MALTITHAKVSALPDNATPAQVQPSDWNASHVLAGTLAVSDLTGTLGVAAGGTGLAAGYAIGDLLVASAAGVLAKLADIAVGNVLLSGGVGAAPSYGKVDLTLHVTGVLPAANVDLSSRVPVTRTINGYALSANITLTAADVGAGPTYTGTANQVIVTGSVLSTPQSIGTGSSPSFAGLTLSGNRLTFGTFGSIGAAADGIVNLLDNAGTAFARLQFGGTTSAFPSLKRTGTTLIARLADDSADAPFTAGVITATSAISSASNVTLGAVGATNEVRWTSGPLIGAPASDILALYNSSRSGFNRLQFGGTTDLFPALARSTTDLSIVGGAAGVANSSLIIPSQKSLTGTRYVVIDTNGRITSSATAPSGT